MNKLTKLLFAIALMFSIGANAQDISSASGEPQQKEKTYKTFPHVFFGLQGGMQTTRTNFDAFELARPTAAVSLGAYFNRCVGARLHVNGIWNKSAINTYKYKYDYNYVTTDLDLLINLTNIFRQGDDHFFNLILIGGIGLNTAWGNDDLNKARLMNANMPYMWDGTKYTHNARVGAQANFNICKWLDFNLEINANSLGDRYNSKMSNKDDWQFTAMAGIAFKFGYKKKPVPVVPDVTPVDDFVEDVNTEPVVVETPAPVEKKELQKKEFHIFYERAKYEVTDEYKPVIKEIATFMNKYPTATIHITGYADKGTGTPVGNEKWSRLRMEYVVKALTEAGISAGRIISEYKGDTVQPFPNDNDKNRVVIGIAEEK